MGDMSALGCEWPPLKETLVRLYSDMGLSTRQIGSLAGKSGHSVRAWLKKFNVSLRPLHDPHPQLADRAWLEQEYIHKNRSAKDIGREIGVSGPTIGPWLDKHGIPRSDNTGPRNHMWKPAPMCRDCDRVIVSKRNGRCKKCSGAAHRGKNSPSYKEPHLRASPAYMTERGRLEHKEWRREVFVRDAFKCVACGKGGGLAAHHVYNFKDFVELRTALDNGATLCLNCHRAFHSRFGARFTNRENFEVFLMTHQARAT